MRRKKFVWTSRIQNTKKKVFVETYFAEFFLHNTTTSFITVARLVSAFPGWSRVNYLQISTDDFPDASSSSAAIDHTQKKAATSPAENAIF